MKILKRASAIAFIYYLAIFLSGCLCKCEKQKYRTFAYEALQLGAIEYEFITDSTFTSRALLEDTIPAFNYGLVLNFSVTKFAANEFSQHSGLINSAIACDCNDPLMKPRDTIAAVVIQTVYDFDATHPAGSDVSGYFAILANTYNPKTIQRYSLDSLAGQADYLHQNLDNVEIPIYLNAAPESPRMVLFKMDVTLKNGKTISALSDEVFIR